MLITAYNHNPIFKKQQITFAKNFTSQNNHFKKQFSKRFYSQNSGGRNSSGSGSINHEFDPKINYYKILGLQESATDQDIKKAFYNLAKQYHPDSIASTSKSHEEKFKEISNAYDILGDTDKKKTYDDIRANINTQSQFKGKQYPGTEWTYKYDQTGRKQSSSNENYGEQGGNRQYYYQDYQDDNFKQNWQGRTYEEARKQYQRSQQHQDYETNNRQGGHSNYHQQYQQYEKEQFQKFKERLRKERAQQEQYQSAAKSGNFAPDEDVFKTLLISFLGFSGVTYLLFGLFQSRTANASGGTQGYQHKPVQNSPLEKWTNANHPSSNYYKPTTFNGKVFNKINDGQRSQVDDVLEYYQNASAIVQIPKIEVKNSTTPIQDQQNKEKEILLMEKKKRQQEQLQKKAQSNPQSSQNQRSKSAQLKSKSRAEPNNQLLNNAPINKSNIEIVKQTSQRQPNRKADIQ